MKYLITEKQYKDLVIKKRNQKIVDEIISKVDGFNNKLNETVLVNEAISDIIYLYNKRGLLNNDIVSQLIESGKIKESQIKPIKL